MTTGGQEAYILQDEAGTYYAIPATALATYRVPPEHAAAVERAVEDLAGDTAGFGHGQGHGQGQGGGQGQGQGRGHGGWRGLKPILPFPVPLPFASITDGTSNTIVFGER